MRWMKNIIKAIPFVREYLDFKNSCINNVPLSRYLEFKLFKSQGGVKGIYWPVHKNSEVTYPYNIFVGLNSNPATRPGCYLQGNGGIYIGNYCEFASNVGIISANHDLYNQKKHNCKPVYIDDHCWIGQGAIILPGVRLGKRTIVGANAVVTKSFPDGYCVVAGNPAKVIKCFDKDSVSLIDTPFRYYGYIPAEKFKERTLDSKTLNALD